jgi:hypothetical protein
MIGEDARPLGNAGEGRAAFDRSGVVELGGGRVFVYLNKILRMPRRSTHRDEIAARG